MMVKIYLDTDDDGNIVSSMAGVDIVPARSFDYFFEVDWPIAQDIHRYRVVDGQLHLREEGE